MAGRRVARLCAPPLVHGTRRHKGGGLPFLFLDLVGTCSEGLDKEAKTTARQDGASSSPRVVLHRGCAT